MRACRVARSRRAIAPPAVGGSLSMHKNFRSGWVLFPLLALVSLSADASVAPTQLASFNPAAGELPESLTIDSAGNFYLSMANTIKKVTPSLQVTTYAT